MKKNNYKNIILFAFACFLTSMSPVFADSTLFTLYKGKTQSIPDYFDGATNCSISPALAGVSVTTTSAGVQIKNEWTGTGSDQTITITCDTSDGAKTKATINISSQTLEEAGVNLSGDAVAQPGTGATCSFGSAWRHQGSHWLSSSGGALPSDCKLPDASYGTFGGWKETENRNMQSLKQENCNGYSKSLTAQPGKAYVACYYTAPYVTIVVQSPASVSLGGDWQRNQDGWSHFAEQASESVSLPTPTLGFGEDASNYGWFKGNTEVSSGTVTHDGGTYVYRKKGMISSSGDDVKFKKIFLNKTAAIVKSGVNITGCTSEDSSYVGASFRNNECQITGNKLTEGTPIEVVVTGDDGKDYIYKITVESQGQGNSQNGDDEFIIDTSSAIIVGKNDATNEEGSFLSGGCDTFNVTAGEQSAPFATTDSGDPMTSAVFNVQSTCSGDTSHYVAFCLDPGRSGPATSVSTLYKKSNEKLKADFRKVINYISKFEAEEFADKDSATRIGSHVAVRAVAIYSGQSNAVDRSDAKYEAHLKEYQKIAKALRAGESATDAVNKLNWKSGKDDIKAVAVEILEKYAAESENEQPNKLTRHIDDGYPQFEKTGSDSYKLTYKGTLTIPLRNEESDVDFDPCDGDGNVTCNVKSFTRTSSSTTTTTEEDGDDTTSGSTGVVYDYEIEINVGSTIGLKLPKTKEDQKKYSFKLQYDGPNSVDNIFLISPATGDTYQRLVVFDLSENENLIYIYFPIEPTSQACSAELLESLNQDNCTEDSCSDTQFNKEVFRAAGCCDYFTNEYVEEKVCGSECTYTTFASVCSYDPSDENGTTETYVIQEGKDGDEDNLGECVVNTTDYLDLSNPSSPSNDEDFEKVDDQGNPRNLPDYDDNKYCRVTCKEDWKFVMDRFGTLVGENAVAAGTYFTDGSSVYMQGSKTCFTNYIDYDSFNDEEVQLSQKVLDQYNEYSKNSHVLTEIELRREFDDDNASFSEAPHLTHGSLEKNTSRTTTSNQVCIQNFTCAESYGSEWEYSSGECRKEVTCGEDEEGPCYDYKDVQCAFKGNAYSYEISVSQSKLQDHTTEGGDKLYAGDQHTKVDHKKAGEADYNSEIEPGTETEAKDNYTASAKLECEITEADADDGDGATGEYKCNLTTTVNGETSEEEVYPTCKEYADNDTVTSPQGDTVSLKNVDNIDKSCNATAFDKTFFEEYSNSFTTDEKGNLSGFQQLADNVQELAKELILAAKEQLNSLTAQIYKNDDDMFNCQHFQLYNFSEGISCQVKIDTKYNNVDGGDVSLGKNREYVTINADYDPTVSYTYDEDAFMTILKDDNILIEYEDKNDKIFKEVTVEGTDFGTTGSDQITGTFEVGGIQDKVNSSNVNNDASPVNKLDAKKDTYANSCGVRVRFTDLDDNEYELDHDYLETKYYNPDAIWTEESEEEKTYGGDGSDTVDVAKKTISLCTIFNDPSTKVTEMTYVGNKEGGGHTVFSTTSEWKPEWYGGKCYKVTLRYLKANYIKQTISNSSFYKTKGSWFVRTSDVKEHGDDLDDAIDNANDRSSSLHYEHTELEYSYWSLLGTGFNVFPIGITTPRNLYQYIYYFGDIGSYDDSSLGRLMGTEKSIITINKRYCFYEIYEDICKCCGDTINTHYDEGEIQITKEFLNNNGLNYPLNEKDAIENSMKLNPDASISFSTSSVALGDLDSDTGRELGNNWSDSSPMFVDGNNFTTEKGSILKEIIEEQGESIYETSESSNNSMIEYRFKLTPDTMGKIRNYNLENGYEINYQNLTVYGKYSISAINEDGTLANSASNFSAPDDILNNKVSTFIHLGSKFLEDEIYSYGDGVVITTLANRKDDDNVCQVTKADLGNGNAETGVEAIRNKMKNENCRWIDYIEENSENKNKYGEHVITRLAFK